MLKELCSKCNICPQFEDSKRGRRDLEWEYRTIMTDIRVPLILVIDDYPYINDYEAAMFDISSLLGGRMDFTYTTAIRCKPNEDLSEESGNRAINSCSVWTRTLLEERKLIITTTFGLQQMGIRDKTVGDMFKTTKYGVVLVVPRLELLMRPEFRTIYHPKIQRVLKEAEL